MNQDEEDVEMIGTGTGTGTRGSAAAQENLDLMLALSLAFDENQPYDADIRRDVDYEFEAGTATAAGDNTLQSQVNAQRFLTSQQAQEESPSRAGLGIISSSEQEQASESNTMPNQHDAMEEEGDDDESDGDGEFIYEDDSDYEYCCESSTASQRSVPNAANSSDGESGTSFEVISHNANNSSANADNSSDNESGTSFEVVHHSGAPNAANSSDGESGTSFEVLSHGVESMDEMSVEDIKNDMQRISLSDDVLPFDGSHEFEWFLPSLDNGIQVSQGSQSTVDVKWKQKCLEVLKGLPYRENRWGFCVPKNIMDLECIEKMLENDVYKAIEDFQSDVNRTFDAAMAYHKEGTVMHERAKEMKAKFKVECINKFPQPGEIPTVPTSTESSNNNTVTNQAEEQSYPTPALPQPCLNVLKGLQDHPYGWAFNLPVDPDLMGLSDYFDVIKKPMDLSTVMRKLQRCEYGAIEEFEADVNLTFDNAMKYNGESSPVYELAQTLKDKFEIDYKRLVLQVEHLIQAKFDVHYKKLSSKVETNVPTAAITPTPEPTHKRHMYYGPTEESVTPIPTRDLTAQNVRWAIEIYAREHPDDLGMPIKKLMKFFGIRRFSPSETRALFEKIINQECLLETTDDIGRVLFLKEKERSSDIGAPKNDEIMDIDGEHKGIDGDRKIEPLSIEYIQKCTSIRELQNMVVRLSQPHAKASTDASCLVHVATQRLRTLREKIALNNEYVDDDDFPGFDELTIEFIENCTSERVLEQIMNRFAPKFSWKWNASFPPIQCEQKYAAKPIAPGTWSFHEAAIKRLKALGHSGTTHETRLIDQHRRLAENSPTAMKMEDMDELVALSLCLDENEDVDDRFLLDYGIEGNPLAELQRVHAEAKAILKNPLPSYYYYDESNLVLRDFLTDPLDEGRKKSALRYISNCTFAAELRGIIHFWEAPENCELGSQLLKSKGRPPFHVGLVEAERKRLHTSFVAFTKAQLKALFSHEYAIRFPSRKLDIEYRSRWFIRDFDIQLTRDIPKGWNDMEEHQGNLWLQDLVAEKLCYVMDGNWESKVVETFKDILQRIKNEGRRFFQLELSRRTNRRLFWIEHDDKLVMNELIYLFRCESNKREAVRSMAQSRDTRFVPELEG